MKILHVNDVYDERGGTQQYLLAVAQLLATHGHDNVVLFRQRSSHTIQAGLWPAYSVEDDEEGDVEAVVRHVLSSERPDVAYIHHVASPALVETVARLLPSVAYVHGVAAVCPGLAKYFRRGDQVCERPFGLGCVPMHYLRRCSAARRPSVLARLMRSTARLRRSYQHVQRFLVATSYMQGLLAQNGFDADRITLLAPHFVDPTAIPPYTVPEQPHLILSVGRLEIEKGIPYLLNAMKLLPSHVHLALIGDGSIRADYEALGQHLGLIDRVFFLGWLGQSELERWYRRCSALVMSPVWPEPFGKTGIEALTHGRPVVAFAVGGIPDWLDDGVTGLLVRPADSADLAQKIEPLLEDRARQEAMGRNGQRVVAERYRAESHLGVLQNVFEGVVSK